VSATLTLGSWLNDSGIDSDGAIDCMVAPALLMGAGLETGKPGRETLAGGLPNEDGCRAGKVSDTLLSCLSFSLLSFVLSLSSISSGDFLALPFSISVDDDVGQ
jgi:hypothetical protein